MLCWGVMSIYQKYIVPCVLCQRFTSKAYAYKHNGQCKACVTGVEPKPKYTCRQCGSGISKFKHDHHYVCEECYKQNDPIGYANEVRGFYDEPDS